MERVAARQALLDLLTLDVRWAGGSESARLHLEDRIAREHLPSSSTSDDYARTIKEVVGSLSAKAYEQRAKPDCLVVAGVGSDSRVWFVKLGRDGLVHTAFPPDRGWGYLADDSYRYIDDVKALLA